MDTIRNEFDNMLETGNVKLLSVIYYMVFVKRKLVNAIA